MSINRNITVGRLSLGVYIYADENQSGLVMIDNATSRIAFSAPVRTMNQILEDNPGNANTTLSRRSMDVYFDTVAEFTEFVLEYS